MKPRCSRLIQRRRYGKDEAQKVLALLETYRREDFLAAIEQAVRYGAYSRSAIERILAVKAVPKTALDQRAEQELRQLNFLLGDPPVPPRPSKEYDQLFDQQTEASSDETSEDSPGADDTSAGPACEDP